MKNRLPEKQLLLRGLLDQGSDLEVYWLAETSSTMDVARELLKEREKPPFLVVTDRQTAGRGRGGNTWQDSQRSLMFSLVLPKIENLEGYALAMALAVYQPVFRLLPTVGIKWPNDLVCKEGKLAGILIEACSGALIIGVGLNVSPPSGELRAAALDNLLSARVEEDKLFAEIISSMLETHDTFVLEGFSAFKEAWLLANYYKSGMLRFKLAGESFEGLFQGITESGQLLLQTASGLKTLSSGEIVEV